MIFVSQATSAAFDRLFPRATPASRRVIYPALRPELGLASGSRPSGFEGRYLLTVGSIGARKNQRGAIAAFAASGLAAQGVTYLICGGPEPGYDEVLAEANRTPGVVILPYVSDDELTWLYRNAEGFVLVSHLEGFGIPVAEAIAHGLVPLVTRESVLHEVAGDGAFLADAEDIGQIATAMTRLVRMSRADGERRRELLHQAIERYSPERFAQHWRTALDEMLAPTLAQK
jgi:glycosyltransferase involved in cell wall biosynthesis